MDMLVFNALDNPGMLEGRYTVVMAPEQVQLSTSASKARRERHGMMIEPVRCGVVAPDDSALERAVLVGPVRGGWTARMRPTRAGSHVRETRPDMGRASRRVCAHRARHSSGSEVRWLTR